jgi:hypothetical protein
MALPHGGGRRFAARSASYNLLLSWISSGVASPSQEDPMLVSVNVAPASQTLALGQRIGIRATARHNNGSTRDVTALVRIEVVDDSVAEIAADGSVIVKARGLAVILARYMGHSAVANLLVPYAPASPLKPFSRTIILSAEQLYRRDRHREVEATGTTTRTALFGHSVLAACLARSHRRVTQGGRDSRVCRRHRGRQACPRNRQVAGRAGVRRLLDSALG